MDSCFGNWKPKNVEAADEKSSLSKKTDWERSMHILKGRRGSAKNQKSKKPKERMKERARAECSKDYMRELPWSRDLDVCVLCFCTLCRSLTCTL